MIIKKWVYWFCIFSVSVSGIANMIAIKKLKQRDEIIKLQQEVINKYHILYGLH